MYECPSCGGNLRFDIPSQKLSCKFCDSKFDAYAIKKETDTVDNDYFETNVFGCPQCGGEMLSDDNDVTSFCSYCGSANILSSRISKEKRPRFIIPFKITKEDCKKAYQSKLKKAFFVPKELKNPDFIDGFRGIYMPYWSYRISQKGRINLRGKKEKRKGDYVYTDHYALSGDLDAGYAGYSCDASSNFYDSISEALGPYKADQILNFTPTFLSGFYAETGDVDAEVYRRDAEEMAADVTYEKMKKDSVFRKYGFQEPLSQKRVEALNTTCEGEDSVMFPVWFMSYRNGERIAYATVNGQTGKVVADLPVDEKRFFGSSLLLAIPLFLILNLLFTLRPTVLLTCSAVLAVIAAFIYRGELGKILALENNEGDRGFQSKRATKNQTKKPSAYEKLMKAVSAVGISIPIMLFVWTFVTMSVTLDVNAGQLILWLIAVVAMSILCVSGMKKYKSIGNLKGGFGFICAAIALVIGTIIQIWQPVSDLWYYGSALFILLTVIFILGDLIRNYNRLAMRKLPQFDKRGGDDNA